jgi:hypothetical protein
MKKPRTTAQLIEEAKKGPPRALFHGTLATNIPGIIESGILPSNPERRVHEDFARSTEGYVSLADDIKMARRFATFAAIERSHDRRLPDTAVVVVDSMKARLRGVLFMPNDAIRQLGGHEWDTADVVPAASLVGYYVYNTSRERGEKPIESYHSL